jgi:hypothetical protein
MLKPGLVVHSVCNGYWFWGRPSVYDLWRDRSRRAPTVPRHHATEAGVGAGSAAVGRGRG